MSAATAKTPEDEEAIVPSSAYISISKVLIHKSIPKQRDPECLFETPVESRSRREMNMGSAF